MSAIPKAVVALVLERDGHACVRCGKPNTGQRGWDWSIQHRVARGAGGSSRPEISSPANLIVLCGSATTGCHLYAESRTTEGRENGWWLWRNTDPESVAVLLYDGRRVFLTADGRYVDAPDSAA